MRYPLLRNLILLLGSIGTIQCFGQTTLDKICLSYPEFDFYAQSYVEKEGLKEDTAIYCHQIIIQDKIITQQAGQLDEAQMIIANKDTAFQKQANQYTILSAKYQSLERKLIRNKKATKVITIVALSIIATEELIRRVP